jgi:hypothetical protein
MRSVGGFVACDQRFIGLKWRMQRYVTLDEAAMERASA